VRFPEGIDLPTHCLYDCPGGPAQNDLAQLVRELQDEAMALVRHASYPTAGSHCSLYLSKTPSSLAAASARRIPFPSFDASLTLRPRIPPGASVGHDNLGRPVLYWSETGTTRLLSSDAARFVGLCSGERSLEEICAAWVVDGRGKALQAWLLAKNLWDAGLLTT
jgi:hypothetical protein